jgi:hypothetical protein
MIEVDEHHDVTIFSFAKVCIHIHLLDYQNIITVLIQLCRARGGA